MSMKRKPLTRPRRENTVFSKIGIFPGAILHLRSDPSVTCKVIDDKKVEYKGKEYYLTSLARKILHEKYGRSNTASTSGCHHFKFEGKALYDIRNAYDILEKLKEK